MPQLFSLFFVPRGPGKHTHIFTHTPQINQRHETDTRRSAWRRKETTRSQTRTHTYTHSHTHTATGTEPETQRLPVNLCAGRHADTPAYGNTNTGLYLGTRVPQTSPQHTHRHLHVETRIHSQPILCSPSSGNATSKGILQEPGCGSGIIGAQLVPTLPPCGYRGTVPRPQGWNAGQWG